MKNNTKKQEILDAYARVIEQKGLEGASISAIAKELGINQSLIFHYFDSKEDLTCELTRQVTQNAVKSYEAAWPQAGVYDAESFERFVAFVLEVHRNRREVISPKLYFALLYLMPRQKTVNAYFGELTDTLVKNIGYHLDQYRIAGIITHDDSEMGARTLLCLADGILCYDTLTPTDKYAAFLREQNNLYLNYIGYRR